MTALSPLFERYISGFAIGELPKAVKKEPERIERVGVIISDSRMWELGYVRTADGWVYHEDAYLLPINGKLTWIERGCDIWVR